MTPLKVELANVPFGQFPSISTEYGLNNMAPGDDAEYVTISWSSTLNQAVIIQPFGSHNNSPQNLTGNKYDIAGSITIAAGNTTTQNDGVSIAKSDFAFSWYGATITTGGTAPTAGRLSVLATIWLKDKLPDLTPLLAQFNQYMAQSTQINQEINQAVQLLLGRPAPRISNGLLSPFLQER